MTTPFDTIRLIWRTAPHTARFVVGSLRHVGDSYQFEYDGLDLEQAKKAGFEGYPGMPLGDRYNGQAMSAFASRLVSRERPDFVHLVSGWGAKPYADDFELLGLTFGRLPTDTFEFVPEVKPVVGTHFYTDLAGLQNYAMAESFRTLPRGTPLHLEANPGNEYDCHAVMVLHNGHQVAHVKRVHSESICRAFEAGLKVSCSVVRVQINGVIKEVVVDIAYN